MKEISHFNVNFSIAIFIIVYSVYHLTLYSSVPGGDSGELLAEACQLGIAHPPGYPLFTILAHLAMRFNIVPRIYIDLSTADHNIISSISLDWNPNPAWRVNNMCAVFGALAALFVYLCVVQIATYMQTEILPAAKVTTASTSMIVFSASCAALLFAFSPLVWEYSISAEVFALNNCLCAVSLYIAIRALQCLAADNFSSANYYIYLGALSGGLALSNQHTSLLHFSYIIIIIIGALFKFNHSAPISTVLKAGIIFLSGLTPYCYLYFASIKSPVGSWGDTSNLTGFMTHVLRSEYGTFRLGGIVGKENWWERIVIYFSHVSKEMFHVPPALLCVGMFAFGVQYSLRERDLGTSVKLKAKAISEMKSKEKETEKEKGKDKQKKETKSSSAVKNKVAASIDSQESTLIKNKPNFKVKHLVAFVGGLFLWYTIIWHCIFSNLPLSAPMPFGVHARFWMQPNIALLVLVGVMFEFVLNTMAALYRVSYRPSLFIQSLLLGPVLSILLRERIFLIHRSGELGWTMHKYAELQLRQIPQKSILLAHTDLNWNPMRYLRMCENHAEQINHFSLQMMPYPWFAAKQTKSFPDVAFPDTNFKGVSTDRNSEGNAKLITDFLHANLPAANSSKSKYFGGIYLDMQSINEAEIESMGEWRGFTLVPWGAQYRAVRIRHYSELVPYQLSSWKILKDFAAEFPKIDDEFVHKFPHGTWEAGAASLFNDAHYQLGLFLLTFGIETQKEISMERLSYLVLTLDRLLAATSLLDKSWSTARLYNLTTSVRDDIQKNSALAHLRLQAIASMFYQFQDRLKPALSEVLNAKPAILLMEAELMNVHNSTSLRLILTSALHRISEFIEERPADRDFQVFAAAAAKLRQDLDSLQ